MGIFEMVVAIVFIATTGEVAKAFFGKRAAGGASEEQIRALQAALRENEARLAQAEEQVAALGEKLHFVEDLLASPERTSQLPPPSR